PGPAPVPLAANRQLAAQEEEYIQLARPSAPGSATVPEAAVASARPRLSGAEDDGDDDVMTNLMAKARRPRAPKHRLTRASSESWAALRSEQERMRKLLAEGAGRPWQADAQEALSSRRRELGELREQRDNLRDMLAAPGAAAGQAGPGGGRHAGRAGGAAAPACIWPGAARLPPPPPIARGLGAGGARNCDIGGRFVHRWRLGGPRRRRLARRLTDLEAKKARLDAGAWRTERPQGRAGCGGVDHQHGATGRSPAPSERSKQQHRGEAANLLGAMDARAPSWRSCAPCGTPPERHPAAGVPTIIRKRPTSFTARVTLMPRPIEEAQRQPRLPNRRCRRPRPRPRRAAVPPSATMSQQEDRAPLDGDDGSERAPLPLLLAAAAVSSGGFKGGGASASSDEPTAASLLEGVSSLGGMEAPGRPAGAAAVRPGACWSAVPGAAPAHGRAGAPVGAAGPSWSSCRSRLRDAEAVEAAERKPGLVAVAGLSGRWRSSGCRNPRGRRRRRRRRRRGDRRRLTMTRTGRSQGCRAREDRRRRRRHLPGAGGHHLAGSPTRPSTAGCAPRSCSARSCRGGRRGIGGDPDAPPPTPLGRGHLGRLHFGLSTLRTRPRRPPSEEEEDIDDDDDDNDDEEKRKEGLQTRVGAGASARRPDPLGCGLSQPQVLAVPAAVLLHGWLPSQQEMSRRCLSRLSAVLAAFQLPAYAGMPPRRAASRTPPPPPCCTAASQAVPHPKQCHRQQQQQPRTQRQQPAGSSRPSRWPAVWTSVARRSPRRHFALTRADEAASRSSGGRRISSAGPRRRLLSGIAGTGPVPVAGAESLHKTSSAPLNLVELFRELQLLSTDFLRQRALLALQELVKQAPEQAGELGRQRSPGGSRRQPPWLRDSGAFRCGRRAAAGFEQTPSESYATTTARLPHTTAAGFVGDERRGEASGGPRPVAAAAGWRRRGRLRRARGLTTMPAAPCPPHTPSAGGPRQRAMQILRERRQQAAATLRRCRHASRCSTVAALTRRSKAVVHTSSAGLRRTAHRDRHSAVPSTWLRELALRRVRLIMAAQQSAAAATMARSADSPTTSLSGLVSLGSLQRLVTDALWPRPPSHGLPGGRCWWTSSENPVNELAFQPPDRQVWMRANRQGVDGSGVDYEAEETGDDEEEEEEEEEDYDEEEGKEEVEGGSVAAAGDDSDGGGEDTEGLNPRWRGNRRRGEGRAGRPSEKRPQVQAAQAVEAETGDGGSGSGDGGESPPAADLRSEMLETLVGPEERGWPSWLGPRPTPTSTRCPR
uniref:PCM1_C domain-containing protein n=1 Tax=Macrostomum lignano TaxID=282301 RepID=A0A1I8FFE8_9PLAT